MEWATEFFETQGYAEMTTEKLEEVLKKLRDDIHDKHKEDEDASYLYDLADLVKEELGVRELPEEFRKMDDKTLADTAYRLDRDIRRYDDLNNESMCYMMNLHEQMEAELNRRRWKRDDTKFRYRKKTVEELRVLLEELRQECTTTGKFQIEAIELELETREQEELFQKGDYRSMTTSALEKKDAELSLLYEWELKRAVGDELDRRARDYPKFSNKYLAWALRHLEHDRYYQPERVHPMVDAELEKVRAEIAKRGENALDESDFCYYRENPRLECSCSRCKCSCGGCC